MELRPQRSATAERIGLSYYHARWYAVGLAGILGIFLGVVLWERAAGGFPTAVVALLLLIPAMLAALLLASWLTDPFALELEQGGVRFIARTGGKLIPWGRIVGPVRVPWKPALSSSRPPVAVTLPIAVGYRWELRYTAPESRNTERVTLGDREARAILSCRYRPKSILGGEAPSPE